MSDSDGWKAVAILLAIVLAFVVLSNHEWFRGDPGPGCITSGVAANC